MVSHASPSVVFGQSCQGACEREHQWQAALHFFSELSQNALDACRG